MLHEYDGVYWPVTFLSRTLKPSEVNYGMVENDGLALLQMLDVCYTMLVYREITVLTRHSALEWLLQSSVLNGDWEDGLLYYRTGHWRFGDLRREKMKYSAHSLRV